MALGVCIIGHVAPALLQRRTMRLTGEEFDLNDMVVDPVEAEGLQS